MQDIVTHILPFRFDYIEMGSKAMHYRSCQLRFQPALSSCWQEIHETVRETSGVLVVQIMAAHERWASNFAPILSQLLFAGWLLPTRPPSVEMRNLKVSIYP